MVADGDWLHGDLERHDPKPLPCGSADSIMNGKRGSLFNHFSPHGRRHGDIAKQSRKQFKIRKGRQINERAAVGDDHSRSGRNGPGHRRIHVGKVFRQILGGVVVVRHIALASQLHESDPRKSQIASGFRGGDATLAEQSKDSGFHKVVSKTLPRILVRGTLGNRYFDLNLHGYPDYTGCG